MKIRPLHDRILVKRVEEQEVRRGGISHPRHREGKPRRARSSPSETARSPMTARRSRST